MMEQEIILKEVLHALKLHTEQINSKISESKSELIQRMDSVENKMDRMEKRMDSMESKMEKGFERLDKKFSGHQILFSETQETVDFLSTKVIQHEKKIRELQKQS